MAIIKPFKGVRPPQDLVEQVASRPYDVLNSEEARKGWCLYDLGCKGPSTYNNCPKALFNQTNWPVGAGHPCIGCSEPNFWDDMTPFYEN